MQTLARPHPIVHKFKFFPKPSFFRSLVFKSKHRYSSSSMAGDQDLADFLDYMENLKNFERSGVPKGAGTDSDDGFDLGRMHRLLRRLGNPHKNYKAVHIAGTKGKGSTAAYLSNILREEGYRVGCYTSPHLLSIRERIIIGRIGDPVPADVLKSLFYQVKEAMDEAVEEERGALTHFEVFTALAFRLFSEDKVDIAVIEAGLGGARDATNVISSSELAAAVITSIGEEHLEALGGSLESIAMAKSGIIKHDCPVVIGGPFEQHIQKIIRDKASAMKSRAISASDPAIRKILKGFTRDELGRAYQICDISIKVQELNSSIDLPDVKLQMLGSHQLGNAIQATCTALCLRDQGLVISDKSIRAGLEQTSLLGRSQFLTLEEALIIGLSGTAVLVDGAHTAGSAKCLSEVIRTTHPDGPVAFLVAMANDKDHTGFAREILSGRRPDVVLLTEASIAGGKSRTTSASMLKDSWIRASMDSGTDFCDLGTINCQTTGKSNDTCMFRSPDRLFLASCEATSMVDSIKIASQLLRAKNQSGLLVMTGSLHIVASVLALLNK